MSGTLPGVIKAKEQLVWSVRCKYKSLTHEGFEWGWGRPLDLFAIKDVLPGKMFAFSRN